MTQFLKDRASDSEEVVNLKEHQAVTKGLTSSSKFSGSCVLTLPVSHGHFLETNLWTHRL
eukprot:CAMPEP_0171191648 /NCGR_PEP_ID=MMETSP0790-20130122/19470_1 /TAXON_ID=2925 /ORGANISM="Alexandrium catenella, Strain OF101" /LENGTH=59 /DNA_ID=CAMNT_0011656797 /DNA_START=1 /DNA_END=177 /DNA_ORIENTATION=-